MTTAETVDQLRRMRWVLITMTVVFAAAGWFAGPLLWALAVICAALAVRNEWVMHRGRQLLRR